MIIEMRFLVIFFLCTFMSKIGTRKKVIFQDNVHILYKAVTDFCFLNIMIIMIIRHDKFALVWCIMIMSLFMI